MAGPRESLARLALDAALQVEGVAAPASPASAPGALPAGVDVVAESPERYGVTLHLVARLVPLVALADAVRDGVARAAAQAGLDAELGSVDVRFEAVEVAE